MTTASTQELLFSTDWFTQNIPSWTRHLAHLKDRPNVRALEVGSWEGRSACWLLQNILTHPTARLTCIDVFESGGAYTTEISRCFTPLPPDLDIEKRFDRNIRIVGGEVRTLKLKGRSEELLRTLPLHHFDLVYIDGSHMASSTLTDAVLAWGTLRIGSILIFDDYGWNPDDSPERSPKLAIDAFLAVFAGQYDILEHGWQVILRKLPRPASHIL